MRGYSGFQLSLAMLGSFVCTNPAGAASCTLNEVASLPMTANADGGIVIPVDLGDGKSHPFLLDASSPQTFVLAHIADELGLHLGGVPATPPTTPARTSNSVRQATSRVPAMRSKSTAAFKFRPSSSGRLP